MGKFIAYLLIPSLLACPSFAAGHSHRGSGMDEPVDHAVRPHIHVCGGHAHHHPHGHLSHGPRPATGNGEVHSIAAELSGGIVRIIGEHDAIAIYFSAVTAVVRRSSPTDSAADRGIFLESDGWLTVAASAVGDRGRWVCHPPPGCGGGPHSSRNLPLRI